MRIPLELDHLIRSDSDAPPNATLPVHLASIEARKALEVEHYLRACALRLELTSVSATSATSAIPATQPRPQQ